MRDVMGTDLTMQIQRQSIPAKGYEIPVAVMTPKAPKGHVLVVHGYGGCKEEQLGLAWRIAEAGFATYAIDLRGHGQHPKPLDHHALDDLEAALYHLKPKGSVAIVAHSFGARLALHSSADFVIAISPAIEKEYSPKSCEKLMQIKSYRVREIQPGHIFSVLQEMPAWAPEAHKAVSVVCGTRDVPDIVRGCQELQANGVDVTFLEPVMHGDIYLTESAIEHIQTRLKQWFA